MKNLADTMRRGHTDYTIPPPSPCTRTRRIKKQRSDGSPALDKAALRSKAHVVSVRGRRDGSLRLRTAAAVVERPPAVGPLEYLRGLNGRGRRWR